MRKLRLFYNLTQILPAFLIAFGINSAVNAETFVQNGSGVVVIDAAYFDSTRVGVHHDTIKIDNSVAGALNDYYLLMPDSASYGGDATTMTSAETDGPAAYYTVNFNTTGTYKIYAHANMANGSFWVMCGDEHARFEDWYNLGSWRYRSNRTSKTDKYLTVDTTGEQTLALVERKMSDKIDKVYIVEKSVSFDPTAYVASDDLFDLTVNGTTVSGFDADTLSYEVTLPVGTTEVSVAGIPVNDSADVVITNNGTIDVSTGSASATITVTSEDASATQDYTISFSVTEAGSDATLSDLTIDGATVNGFTANDTIYDVILGKGISSVKIGAIPTDEAAVVATADTGTFVLSGLLDTAKVHVTAQDGETIKTYTINFEVYVEDTLSVLSDLTIGGYTVQGFDSTITSYTVYLNTTKDTTLTIGAIASSDSAVVADTGAVTLTTGVGTVQVLVTAENSSYTKTYTITYSTMPAGSGSTQTQTAAGIVDFEAEDYVSNHVGVACDYWTTVGDDTNYYEEEYVLAPAVNTAKYGDYENAEENAPRLDYTINFVDTLPVYMWGRAYFKDGSCDSYFYGVGDSIASNYSKVNGWNYLDSLQWVKGTDAVDIETVGEKTFSIYAREWSMVIDRIILTTDNDFNPNDYIADSTLIDLTVDGTTITDFKSDSVSYSVVLPAGTSSLEIGAVAYNANAEVVIAGADAINAEGGEITVTVTSEDGNSELTYTITYTVETTNETTGMSTSVFDAVTVYPIPATDVLTVTNVQNAELKIYNLQGSLVERINANSSDLSIDLSDISAGMYILEIRCQGQIKNVSFIKQ